MTLDQNTVSRELGNMEARLDRLEADVTEIKGDMKQVLELSTKAKMGFTILASVATAGGAVGAALPSILRAIGGTAMVAALICISACSSERKDQQEFVIVGELNGQPVDMTILGQSTGTTTTGPDNKVIEAAVTKAVDAGMTALKAQIPGLPAIEAAVNKGVSDAGIMARESRPGLLGGDAGGALGLGGVLAGAAGAGWLALKNRGLGQALSQTVQGIQAFKESLDEDTRTKLHTELGVAQDSKTKRMIKGYKA
jgi:hypothetical protein